MFTDSELRQQQHMRDMADKAAENRKHANSTFYADGFRDGSNGLHASPPAPYSFSGHTTNVFACEYLQGWQAGHRQWYLRAMQAGNEKQCAQESCE